MNCRDVEKTLSAYLDGELAPGRKDVVASHLSSCEACRSRLAEWGAVWKALDALPVAESSPAFRARVLARLRQTRPSASERLERFLIPVSAAAVALLGFWVGYIAGGGGSSTARAPESASPIASTAYLDSFSPVPAASAAEVYFAINNGLESEVSP
jgi:anti-sigma factor RsiW